MKREVLVRLNITGATDTHCRDCVHTWDDGCLWGYRFSCDKRPQGCIDAEKAAKESEGAK